MTLVTWNESLYGVGVESIDKQHKKLVDMVNGLNDCIQQGACTHELGNIMAALVEYTQTHFADEERVMEEIGYKGLRRQKAEHQTMVKNIKSVLMRLKKGESVSSRELLSFMKIWWTDHILREDSQIGLAIAAREKNETPTV